MPRSFLSQHCIVLGRETEGGTERGRERGVEREALWREDGEGGLMEKTWIASFIFVTTLYRARQRDRRGNREGEGEGGGERSVVERGWGGGANGEDLDCLVHFCHNTVSC